MKQITVIISIILLGSVLLNAQDSSYKLTKAQLARYRRGYIIDTKNDTLKGLIHIDSDTSIRFISDKKKVIISATGNPSRVPVIPAEYNIVRSFYRNGIFYKRCLIPPGDRAVYLGLLEGGRINLYALITDYSDKQLTDRTTNSSFEGLFGSMANSMEKTEEEYFTVDQLYLQKLPDSALIYLSKNEKKFREAFIPMIRDNPAFVHELAGQPVEYYRVRSLIRQYNEHTSEKN